MRRRRDKRNKSELIIIIEVIHWIFCALFFPLSILWCHWSEKYPIGLAPEFCPINIVFVFWRSTQLLQLSWMQTISLDVNVSRKDIISPHSFNSTRTNNNICRFLCRRQRGSNNFISASLFGSQITWYGREGREWRGWSWQRTVAGNHCNPNNHNSHNGHQVEEERQG